MSGDSYGIVAVQGETFTFSLQYLGQGADGSAPVDLTSRRVQFVIRSRGDATGSPLVVLDTGQASDQGTIAVDGPNGLISVEIYGPVTEGLHSHFYAIWLDWGTDASIQVLNGSISFTQTVQGQ